MCQKRPTTQHGCLPSLLGDGGNGIEIQVVYGEEKNILYWPTRAAKTTNKNLLYRQKNPNEPTKEGTFSFVFFASPFTSVSTVSRGHSSLYSLSGMFTILCPLLREVEIQAKAILQERHQKSYYIYQNIRRWLCVCLSADGTTGKGWRDVGIACNILCSASLL